MNELGIIKKKPQKWVFLKLRLCLKDFRIFSIQNNLIEEL